MKVKVPEVKLLCREFSETILIQVKYFFKRTETGVTNEHDSVVFTFGFTSQLLVA